MGYKQYFDSLHIADGSSRQWEGAGIKYPVILSNGSIYIIYIDTNGDPGYKKSTDYGVSWGSFVALKACTAVNIACWFDAWSNISATAYIHVVYTDSDSDDTFYRYIDTADSDTLGTERTVYSGSSTANGSALAITRARGGNLVCATCIDAGAEYDTVKSSDLFVNKTSIAEVWEGATTDQVILVPGWAADNQDVMAFFWDASADEISRKLYDDSGDSWAEASIAGTMVDVAATSTFPHFAAAVDITNSQNVLVAWSAVDTANADLRCWKVTESAITEVTNVVLNSTDDQGFAAISININTGLWTVFYGGKSDGSETWNSSIREYFKTSADAGTTWSSESAPLSNLPYGHYYIFTCPLIYSFTILEFGQYAATKIMIPTTSVPRASYQLGM